MRRKAFSTTSGSKKSQMWIFVLAATLSVFLAMSQSSIAGGRFEGKLVTEALDDGRNLLVVEPFAFIDAEGAKWRVPKGTQTDGASVPRFFWSLYPPFSGKYRKAAVVHDVFCQTRERAWHAVHRMFYDAMVTAGVDDITAKAMYGAVYAFGPRWNLTGANRAAQFSRVPDATQQQITLDLEKWIQETNPTPDEIAARVRAMRVR